LAKLDFDGLEKTARIGPPLFNRPKPHPRNQSSFILISVEFVVIVNEQILPFDVSRLPFFGERAHTIETSTCLSTNFQRP
jgi:hypothetical protein